MKSSQSGETALHYACRQGHCEATSLLIDLDAVGSNDKQGFSVFQRAVDDGQLEIVKVFLSKPRLARLTRWEEWKLNTALHWASYDNTLEVCNELLSLDPECLFLENEESLTPLHYPAMKGHLSVASLLIKSAED